MGLLEPARRPLPLPREGGIVAATLPTLDDLEVDGRRVLVRADLNVPVDDGRITDDFRIRAFEPTLRSLRERRARVVVCSHFGRPKGRDDRYSLRPVAAALGLPLVELEKGDVLGSHDAVLLENLRFEPGETKNDPAFADALASLADAYVNDAFGACHRAHASIVGPPARLPSAAGPLLRSEVTHLTRLLEAPQRPYVLVLGGSKVADKIGVVRNLLDRADAVLLGGGMCFTFLAASGRSVGRSLVDDARIGEVRELLDGKVVLPVDVVTASGVDASSGTVRDVDDMPDDEMGVDIGPRTGELFAEKIRSAATVFWNGPMGVYENPAFTAGTRAVAEAVQSCPGYTATGGGDVVAAIDALGMSDAVDFTSTGGGASLEFLEGKVLPGIAALKEA